MKQINEKLFKEVCGSSETMAIAASKLGLHFNTFKRYAVKLGCYSPNQAGVGLKKRMPLKVETSAILSGNHPSFQSYKLKGRLLKEGIITYQCAICLISDWNGKSISLELDHIDGNSSNHSLENLRLLCPNCHSQTDTFRSKNKSKKNLSAS